MRPVLLLLLIAAAAHAQAPQSTPADVARRLVGALNGQGDPKAFCNEWEAPGWGPQRMKALPRAAYTVGETTVNVSRAPFTRRSSPTASTIWSRVTPSRCHSPTSRATHSSYVISPER